MPDPAPATVPTPERGSATATAATPPPEVMAWLHETYKPEGVEVWLASWRKANPERRAFLERLAHMDGMGT